MRALAVSIFLGLVFSILNVPLTFAGGWAGKQSYTSFDGKTYKMRAYNGKHVALLIQEKHLNSINWLQIKESYGGGPWPGFKDEYLEFLVDQLDAGYEFYTELFGHEPAENPGAPNGLLRIAFPDETCGAGCGLVGMKGLEIGPYYLEASIYAAKEKKVQQTIFWHELGRNFGIGYNDFGIKYVLVSELKVPTFMGWEYGVSYRQFELNDIYLIPRYYLADPRAKLEGYGTDPYKRAAIPPQLTSEANYNANSSTLRAAMSNHYYLENGLKAYGEMVKESDSYNSNNTELGSINGLIAYMTEKNGLGLDYSFWQKNNKWAIKSKIELDQQNTTLSQSAGKVGDFLLLGRDNDFVQITTQGQFRIDAGDGYDVVKLPFPRSSVTYDKQTRWKRVILTASSKIVLDFVEKIEFSDGSSINIKNSANSMFPWLKEIKAGTYKIGNKQRDAIRFSFTEPLATKFQYDWHWSWEDGSMYPWHLALKTKKGTILETYTEKSNNTIFQGSDLYFILPNNYKTRGSNELTLYIHENGYSFEAVDKDANRLARQLMWDGKMIPYRYTFDVRSVGR